MNGELECKVNEWWTRKQRKVQQRNLVSKGVQQRNLVSKGVQHYTNRLGKIISTYLHIRN